MSDCRKAMRSASLIHSLSGALNGLVLILSATTLGTLTDSILTFSKSAGIHALVELLLCILVSVLAVPFMATVGDVLMLSNALKHDRMVLERFIDKKYLEVTKISEGEAQFRLDNDVNDLRCTWVDLVKNGLTVLVMTLTVAYFALRISVLYTFLVIMVSLIKLAVPIAVRKLKQKYDRQNREYRSDMRKYEVEITDKPHLIRMFGMKSAMIRRIDRRFAQFYKEVLGKSTWCSVIADNIAAILDTVCMLLILFIGVILVASGKVTISAIASMIGFFAAFNQIIENIGFIIQNLPIVQTLLERIELLYSDAEDTGGEKISAVKRISAEHLSFSYKSDEEKGYALRDISFDISLGSKVAIVGANGSGKSTLVKLICGLLGDYEGSLKLNESEFLSVSLDSWRSQIAYAPQDPFLFAGTVRENIALGNPTAEKEKVDRVMKQLGITELAEREVSYGQDDLSGGEKQKVSIARALMRDVPYLILDEPSNNLDASSLHWLCGFIRDTDKTVVYISHDEELTSAADGVIAL